jgi:hypothetical protein
VEALSRCSHIRRPRRDYSSICGKPDYRPTTQSATVNCGAREECFHIAQHHACSWSDCYRRCMDTAFGLYEHYADELAHAGLHRVTIRGWNGWGWREKIIRNTDSRVPCFFGRLKLLGFSEAAFAFRKS